MMGFLIEIGATAIDVIFMVWFVVRFQGYLLRNKLYTWIWGGVFLIYQIFIDYFYHGFDLLPIFGVFIIALGCALSVDFSKKTWAIFSAFLYVIVIMLSSSLVFATFSIVDLHVPFSEINKRYGVNLPTDKEMLDLIRDALLEHGDIISDLETSEDFDMMFYTMYCPYVEGDEIAEDDGERPQFIPQM